MQAVCTASRRRENDRTVCNRLWKQIEGFSRYGFCHGHAVAFADHAQGTAWLLRHHPADFLAAVLSVEPCGFWPVATVVAEARRRGIGVLAPCVNESEAARWTVTNDAKGKAIRCSLSYVRGLDKAAAQVEQERRERGHFESPVQFCRRCHFLSREQLEWLALFGALDGLNKNRRQTLWSLPSLHQGHVNSPKGAAATGQTAVDLDVPPLLPSSRPEFPDVEAFLRQWQAIGFSCAGHPMLFHREHLVEKGVMPCAELQALWAGKTVTLAGLVVRPHRPLTAGGTVFFTLVDETGLAQVIVQPEVYQRVGADIYGHAALVVSGKAEKRGSGVNLLAQQMSALD